MKLALKQTRAELQAARDEAAAAQASTSRLSLQLADTEASLKRAEMSGLVLVVRSKEGAVVWCIRTIRTIPTNKPRATPRDILHARTLRACRSPTTTRPI